VKWDVSVGAESALLSDRLKIEAIAVSLAVLHIMLNSSNSCISMNASVNSSCSKVLAKFRYWFILALSIAFFVIMSPSLHAQDTPSVNPTNPATNPETIPTESNIPEGNVIDGFPVILGSEPLFYVREGVDDIASAEERAVILTQRITRVAQDLSISSDDIRVEAQDNQSLVLAGDNVLFTVRQSDAEAYGQPHPVLAAKAVDRIRAAVIQYRQERSLRSLIVSTIATILSTLAIFVFLRGLFFVSSKLLTYIQKSGGAGTLALNIQNLRILGSSATSYLLSGLVRLGRLILVLVAFYLYVPYVLSQFPATEAFGDSLLQDVVYRIHLIVQAFVSYLPELAIIGVIALVTYYLIGFAKQVINELGRPGVYPWFYEEWIQPTIRLITFFMIAIALVVASPYLPGFGSPAFQGVSLFLGALVTLGSSSAVANAVAGIILIYTRAFRIGDCISIGNIIGTVKEKSLFVTRMLTPKKETITIPNSAVLNSNVTNYTAICRESGSYLVLHTTITLGYDIPWRDIHDVLIHAAQATPHIEPEPAPFVLQTSLNDFNVSYQINAYTNRPDLMPITYSELHQNIQDFCNDAGIEILSPAFSALRDGNHSTIPSNYLPADYQAPAFSISQPISQTPNHLQPNS
jgi:small-conductance mechanosensitive channel